MDHTTVFALRLADICSQIIYHVPLTSSLFSVIVPHLEEKEPLGAASNPTAAVTAFLHDSWNYSRREVESLAESGLA